MKIYFFLAVFSVSSLLVSCSSDETLLTQKISSDIVTPDNDYLNTVQTDSIGSGEPIPPKGKDE